MSNHLIIGLGGTGGNIIREFRKKVYETFNSKSIGYDIHVEYLYADSSEHDLKKSERWEVAGDSIGLFDSQKVDLHEVNLDILNNPDYYNWNPVIEADHIQTIGERLRPFIASRISGQCRRMGKLLIYDNLKDFEEKVQGAVRRLQEASAEAKVTFHICANLAGGIGVGTIVDVISQIRRMYPVDTKDNFFEIRVLVYLPESELQHPEHDTGFYQANGYAALQELNAMGVNAFHPINLSEPVDPFTGFFNRSPFIHQPFEVCYVFSDTNENGNKIEINSLPSIVADFLLQSMINPGKIKMYESVDFAQEDEKDIDGKNIHSRKFFSFGTSNIFYPTKKIQSFAAYKYAQQSIQQMLCNQWTDKGYQTCKEDEIGIGLHEEIQNMASRSSLMLDTNHLMLEIPIQETSDSKQWKSFSETWRNYLDFTIEEVKTYDKQQWCFELENRCREFFDHRFRNHQGVKEFFQAQAKDININDYAHMISNLVEAKLFNDFAEGSKSLMEIEKYIILLSRDLNDRIAQHDKQISRLRDEELPKLEEEGKNKKWEFSRISWIRGIITKTPEKMLEQYKEILCDYYLKSTQIEAYHFANVLLTKTIQRLDDLQDVIQRLKAYFIQLSNELEEKSARIIESMDENTVNRIRCCDTEKVQQMVNQCITHPDRQQRNAKTVRDCLIATIDAKEGVFDQFYTIALNNSLFETIVTSSRKNAVSDMEDIAINHPEDRISGTGILTQLCHENVTDESIMDLAKFLLFNSSPLAQINYEEQCKMLPGMTVGGMFSQANNTFTQVTMPAAKDESESLFRQRLIDAFCKILVGFNTSDVFVGYNDEEITCTTVRWGFPLRHLSNLVTLREKYEALCNAPDGELNRKLLHTESFTEPLPPLF